MPAINSVTIVGRVVDAPATHNFPGGRRCALVKLRPDAEHDPNQLPSDSGRPPFVAIIYDDIADYDQIAEGDEIFVHGTLNARTWTDERSVNREAVEIIVRSPQGSLRVLTRTSRSVDDRA